MPALVARSASSHEERGGEEVRASAVFGVFAANNPLILPQKT
jgi:hypothetical protein